MNHIHAQLGELDCQWVDRIPADRSPELLVVLCHGYGAPGNDLVPLGEELLQRFPDLATRVRFVFPAAPLALAGPFFGGRAWWHIDMERLQGAFLGGDLEPLTRDVPPGLKQARRLLRGMLDRLTAQTRLSLSQVVLGGFSQGAMLTTDLGLQLEEAPAALCLFSGSLICAEDWSRRVSRRAGLRVLQSHGRQDEILPYALALRLCKLLEDGGLEVDFLPFDGGHTIDVCALDRLGSLLRSLLPR